MSIIFSAICPHSPILIPSIGKENTSRLKETLSSYEKLEKALIESNPDTILIISPHGNDQKKSLVMNLRPDYIGNFEDFGDFSVKLKYSGDYGLAYKIREKLETKSPLQLISDEKLDYGSLVPLFLLTKKIPQVKIIPVHTSHLSLLDHFDFGVLLQEEIIKNNEKIAVIASSDLSHSLSKDSPAPYSSKAKKFDQKVIEYLKENNTSALLKINDKLMNEVNECGLRPIMVLQGVLSKIKHTPKALSYEHPFGVGYLTMNFQI